VARDILSADKVRGWALELAARDGPHGKVAGAYAIADAMELWRARHGGGKVPD